MANEERSAEEFRAHIRNQWKIRQARHRAKEKAEKSEKEKVAMDAM